MNLHLNTVERILVVVQELVELQYDTKGKGHDIKRCIERLDNLMQILSAHNANVIIPVDLKHTFLDNERDTK